MSLFRIYQMYLELNLKKEIIKYHDKYNNLLYGYYRLNENQDIDSPQWNYLCKDIIEINVKIAYEIQKSDKLYILKENIEALFKDYLKEFDNKCNKRYFEEFKQLFHDVSIVTKNDLN